MLPPMEAPHADELRVLEDKFPGWQIWVVGVYVAPGTRGQRWCAQLGKRHLEADTAGHLAEYIAEWPDL